jgi:hypothetical protein
MIEDERYVVVKKRGVDLEFGDRVWLQQAVGLYDDGGGFFRVFEAEEIEIDKHAPTVHVHFEPQDSMCPVQPRVFSNLGGAYEYVLVLVKEGS